MLSEPRIEERGEQPYLAVRSQVPMERLPEIIPQGIGEVHGVLLQQGIRPANAPFVRYHVINMPGMVDISVGWTIATAACGTGQVTAGVLPAGRYASLIYTGVYPGLSDATAALLTWGAEKRLEWDTWQAGNGEAFGARLESYLTNPADETDQSKHETEIAIRLANR